MNGIWRIHIDNWHEVTLSAYFKLCFGIRLNMASRYFDDQEFFSCKII